MPTKIEHLFGTSSGHVQYTFGEVELARILLASCGVSLEKGAEVYFRYPHDNGMGDKTVEKSGKAITLIFTTPALANLTQ
jgi:hypothetical protein